MIELRCPACGCCLTARGDAYVCADCGRDYPIVLGIPDLRVFPDPHIGYVDDRAKGLRVLEDIPDADFETIVRHYWELTPDVPRDLVQGYVSHVLAASRRAESLLDEARTLASRMGARPGARNGALLEIGCGTGGLLIAAARQYEQVVGVDIAFRWLAIATRRIQEAVRTGELTAEQAARIQLVCACAEHLPVPTESFDIVIGASTIEHIQHQEEALRKASIALRPSGLLLLTTVNRLSVAPEPHVHVWGVGFLPRTWMDPYVRRVRGVPYRYIRLLSSPGIGRLLHRTNFARHDVYPATIATADLSRYSPLLRTAARVYSLLRGLPLARQTLTFFGPLLHVAAVRELAQPVLNQRLTVRRPAAPKLSA